MFNEKDNNVSIQSDKMIFKYLKPENNNILSDMRGIDLQDLLILLDNYYLELRDELGIEKNATFGLELEFEYTMYEKIKEKISDINIETNWCIKHDSSLVKGAEINSPILNDNKDYWETLKLICNMINQFAQIGSNSGGHIHIGSHIIGNKKESWLNFIKLWSVYENIIFRFGYGEFLTNRPNIQNFAKPVSLDFLTVYKKIKKIGGLADDILKEISKERKQAVNLCNVDLYTDFKTNNTIEFRCPNATLDPVIWQNNVNLFIHILLYSKNKNFNEDIVNKRKRKNANKYTDIELYSEIYLQQSLELCDMIFDNNLDKIYFLRQYLKSGETCIRKLEKAKPFTIK